jgi:hypothetical protein
LHCLHAGRRHSRLIVLAIRHKRNHDRS